jgi:hypothetical protein
MPEILPIRYSKPHFLVREMWFFVLLTALIVFINACGKDESLKPASLILKTGTGFTANEAIIPVGGSIHIGILASGAGVPLTYLRIERIANGDTLIQLDKGIFAGSEGFDADFTFAKSESEIEIWRIIVMNADRQVAEKSFTIHLGAGTAYGPIWFYDNIKLSFQNNHQSGHFLDVNTGLLYDENTVAGHEAEIDLLCYYYITSGLSSPTFTCPGYTAAVGYYPLLNSWTVKNNTLYDYLSSDNNLISISEFDQAQNDSLLVTAYQPNKVSGNCKYGYTGKVIPFKTQQGKYGLVKVIQADEVETGTITVAVKIQK